MADLIVFPTEMPLNEMKIVLNGIRKIDDGYDLHCRIVAAQWVAGYAFQNYVPHTFPSFAVVESDASEQAAALLDSAIAADDGTRKAIPWATLWAVLKVIIEQWLNQA